MRIGYLTCHRSIESGQKKSPGRIVIQLKILGMLAVGDTRSKIRKWLVFGWSMECVRCPAISKNKKTRHSQSRHRSVGRNCRIRSKTEGISRARWQYRNGRTVGGEIQVVIFDGIGRNPGTGRTIEACTEGLGKNKQKKRRNSKKCRSKQRQGERKKKKRTMLTT